MKKYFVYCSAAILTLCTTSSFAINPKSLSEKPLLALNTKADKKPVLNDKSNKVVATSKNGDITESQVQKFYKPYFENEPQLKDKKLSDLDPQMRNILIENYINTLLIEKSAIEAKTSNSALYKERVEAAKKDILLQTFREEYTNSKLKDTDINKKYDEWLEKAQNTYEFKLAQIVVQEEKEAQTIKQKLDKGAKFIDLVKEFSTDETSKDKAGEIAGYINPENFGPEISNKISSVKVGKISEPIKLPTGHYYIFKVLDKRKIQIPPKSTAIASIKESLRNQIISQLINELRIKYETKLKSTE